MGCEDMDGMLETTDTVQYLYGFCIYFPTFIILIFQNINSYFLYKQNILCNWSDGCEDNFRSSGGSEIATLMSDSDQIHPPLI
jgi:hypothetical protein